MYFVYTQTIGVVEREKRDAVEEILTKTSQSMNLTLIGLEEGGYEIAGQNGFRKGLQDFEDLNSDSQEKIVRFVNRRFEDYKGKNPYIQQLLCITEKGRILSYGGDISIDKTNFLQSELYKNMSNSKDDVFWEYSLGSSIFKNTDQREFFYVVHKIKTVWREGNVGYLFTIINLKNFKSLYEDTVFGETGGMAIYDNYKSPVLSKTNYILSKDIFDSIVKNKKFYSLTDIRLNEGNFLAGLAPLRPLGWYIEAIVPKEELTGTIKNNLQRSFGIIVFISFIVAMLIVLEIIILSRTITEKEVAHYRLILSEEMNEKLRIYKHDFMNHLQIIRGLIELEYPKRALEYLKSVADEGMIIRTRYEIGIPEIESTIFTGISKARERGIDVEIDCIELPRDIHIKVYDLSKILSNLIKNAVYALDKSDGEEKKLKIKIYEELGEYVFEIINNVPIINKDIRDKIFTRGFTTKGKEGNGLGLAIVKKLVEKNNGVINLKIDEEGNHFIVRFPIR